VEQQMQEATERTEQQADEVRQGIEQEAQDAQKQIEGNAGEEKQPLTYSFGADPRPLRASARSGAVGLRPPPTTTAFRFGLPDEPAGQQPTGYEGDADAERE
jgi:hypothetical protein